MKIESLRRPDGNVFRVELSSKERNFFSHKDFSRYSEGLLHVAGVGEVNALRDAGEGFGNFPARKLNTNNTNRLPAVQPERGDGLSVFGQSITGCLLLLGRQETIQRSAIIFSRLFSRACVSLRDCVSPTD